MDNNEYLKQL